MTFKLIAKSKYNLLMYIVYKFDMYVMIVMFLLHIIECMLNLHFTISPTSVKIYIGL